MGRQKEKRLNLIMRMGRMRGWPLLPGASFLYSSSVPSSTGVVEGGISEEPSGASETRNVIDVAHYRHPAAPFLPPTPSPECNWFDKAPSAGCTRRGTGGSSADPPKNQPKQQWNNPPEWIRRNNPPEWIRRNRSAHEPFYSTPSYRVDVFSPKKLRRRQSCSVRVSKSI